jgi:hypothetical protein
LVTTAQLWRGTLKERPERRPIRELVASTVRVVDEKGVTDAV